MDAKTYIIEILLRAREEITKVAQRALDKMNEVVDAQKASDRAHQESVRHEKAHVSSIERLVEAHTREKKSLDDKVAAINGLVAARKAELEETNRRIAQLEREMRTERAASDVKKKAQVEEIRNLRELAAARELELGKADKQVKNYRQQAAALETASNAEAAAHDKTTSTLNSEISERRNRVSQIKEEVSALERVATQMRDNEQQGRGFIGWLRRIRAEGDDADASLSKLALSLRGFQVAFAIKYAQALITVLIGLVATLVSVASSAIQAGIALGASLASGAAQALPIITLLTAAAARVTTVFQAIKQTNQQQLISSHDAAAAADRHRSAARSIATAEEAVAAANRNTAKAVRDLRDARREAIREVQDLIAAEAAAQRQADQTALSLENAQAALRQARRTGDVSAIAGAELDVEDARASRTQSRRDVTRARQDAAPVRARGVDATDRVKSATEAVTNAKRQETQASQQLSQAREDAARAATKETAANDRLQAMLSLLSPAERRLYDRLLRLQGIYRRAVRPITDIIINSFSRVVDRIASVLQDPKVLGAFTKLAGAISKSIDRLTSVGTGGRSRGFFTFMADQAAKNLPAITSILEKLFKIFQNIARAAAPAFKLLLGFLDELAGRGERASGNIKKLSEFFKTGVRYLRSWVELGVQIARFFLAVIGASAEQGTKSIDSVTDSVRGATEWIQSHGKRVRRFFADAADVAHQVWRIIKAIGGEMLHAFSPKNVQAFADFLINVAVPALGATVEIMGKLTQIAHEILSLPLVSDFAQWVVTVALVSKGFSILSGALKSVGAMIGFVSKEGKLAFVGNPWVLAITAIIAAVVLLDRKFHFLAPTFQFIKKVAGDVFGFIKKVAEDFASWISDVWNQGVLKWLRTPFELYLKFGKFVFGKIIDIIGDAIGFIKSLFSSGPGKAIVDIITLPFKLAKNAISTVFGVVKDIIGGFLDLLAGRFKRVGDRIASIFSTIFNGIKDAVITILNTIIGGVNIAIRGLNLLPGVDIKEIPKIGDKGKDVYTGKGSAGGALAGNDDLLGGFPSNKAAAGAMVSAKPGGRVFHVAEGGYDEVILSTDPKHRNRSASLLLDYLKKAGMSFDRGGWVQGAAPTPPGNAITTLSRALFGLGFNATSGAEYRGTGTYHDRGMATDWGDTANNLRKLWTVLFPQRRAFAELFGPTYLPRGGLYHGTSRFYDSKLQADHQDHIHVAIDQLARTARQIGRIFGKIASLELPGVFSRPIRDLIGPNPRGRAGAFASQGLGAVWDRAKDAIEGLKEKARQRVGQTGDFSDLPSGGGGSPAENKRLAYRMYNDAKRRLGGTFSMLDYIIMHESSYRTNAAYDPTDPFNHAYGIPQANPGTKMASAGRDWKTNPATQLKWMFNYIVSRYGGLPQAYDYKRTQGVYEYGGDVPGRGPVRATLHGGEHVWTASEVARAGGHHVMRALRSLFGGGGQGYGSYKAGGRVLEIGDSLGVGIEKYLEQAIKRINTDNLKGRSSESAIDVLKDKLGKAYKQVILDVGTNDATAGALAKSLHRAIRLVGDRQLIVSRLHGPGSEAKNTFLEGFARRHSNVTLIDPRGKVGPDGIHYTGAGYERRSKSFISAVDEGGGPGSGNAFHLRAKGLQEILHVITRNLDRAKHPLDRLRQGFARIFEEGGLLDQLASRSEEIATGRGVQLQQRQFEGGRHPHRNNMSPVALARFNRGTLNRQRSALEDEAEGLLETQKAAQAALHSADLRLARAKKGSKKYKEAQKMADQAHAALANVRERINNNETALAQNSQDQVEALEAYQQALADAVSQRAERRSTNLERLSRLATALGRTISPIELAKAQERNMRQQISELEPILRAAEKSGNKDLANTIKDQMSELSIQIAESVASQFQSAIDEVNNTAADALASNDRAQRMASITGVTDFGSLDTALRNRGGILANQRAGLTGLLGEATAAGNIDQIKALTNQLADLDVTIAENSQAVKDNTNAAFADRVGKVNEAFSFTSGVAGAASTFFTGLGDLTGNPATATLLGLGQLNASALNSQRGGLLGALADLIGYTGSERDNLTQLSGADLVNTLVSMSQGPIFESIMSRLDPAQQSAFKELINSLIANASATVDNTKALESLSPSTNQGFSSTAWQWFRQAIFTGSGGLLPRYTIPAMDVGGKILQSGAVYAHRGEVIPAAVVSRGYTGPGSGMHAEINVTEQVETADAEIIANRLMQRWRDRPKS